MIEAIDITKSYANGGGVVKALDSASLKVDEAEFIMIVGRSGSGKSTLLSVLGGLTRPTSGNVNMDGKNIWKMSDQELSRVRAREIGFVFQFSGLLPTLNAVENVMLPSMFSNNKSEASKRAVDLLESLGIGNKADSYPSQLSGGELKRVAIARSLINGPKYILADEPTGDLDVDTERDIMDLFKRINQTGKTIVLVTHNPDLSPYATRLLRMDKGRIGDWKPHDG